MPFVERRKEASVTLARHEEQLREESANAYARGHVAGAEAARLEETARLASAVNDLTRILQQSAQDILDIEFKASREALGFALQFSEILCEDLLAASPLAQIEAAARKVFGDLRGMPHFAVRVAPDLVEPVQEKLAGIAKEIGLEAKMIVMGEPEIAAGDCRIEWADGGIVRNVAALRETIREAASQALAATAPNGSQIQDPSQLFPVEEDQTS